MVPLLIKVLFITPPVCIEVDSPVMVGTSAAIHVYVEVIVDGVDAIVIAKVSPVQIVGEAGKAVNSGVG